VGPCEERVTDGADRSVGARTPAQLTDAIDALAITLTPSEVSAIEAAVPASAVAGTRYAAPQMAVLDSEK
jgi:hypothetical protein